MNNIGCLNNAYCILWVFNGLLIERVITYKMTTNFPITIHITDSIILREREAHFIVLNIKHSNEPMVILQSSPM